MAEPYLEPRSDYHCIIRRVFFLNSNDLILSFVLRGFGFVLFFKVLTDSKMIAILLTSIRYIPQQLEELLLKVCYIIFKYKHSSKMYNTERLTLT